MRPARWATHHIAKNGVAYPDLGFAYAAASSSTSTSCSGAPQSDGYAGTRAAAPRKRRPADDADTLSSTDASGIAPIVSAPCRLPRMEASNVDGADRCAWQPNGSPRLTQICCLGQVAYVQGMCRWSYKACAFPRLVTRPCCPAGWEVERRQLCGASGNSTLLFRPIRMDFC